MRTTILAVLTIILLAAAVFCFVKRNEKKEMPISIQIEEWTSYAVSADCFFSINDDSPVEEQWQKAVKKYNAKLVEVVIRSSADKMGYFICINNQRMAFFHIANFAKEPWGKLLASGKDLFPVWDVKEKSFVPAVLERDGEEGQYLSILEAQILNPATDYASLCKILVAEKKMSSDIPVVSHRFIRYSNGKYFSAFILEDGKVYSAEIKISGNE